MKPLFSGQI